MSQEIVRDKKNNIVGYIRKMGNRECVYDKGNKLLGWYDENINLTRDNKNNLVGKGNQIKKLL